MGQEDDTTPAASAVSSAAPAPNPSEIAHLVLDSGALIKGQGYRLAGRAGRFWTIPEVVAEVRDPKSRYVVLDGVWVRGEWIMWRVVYGGR